MCGTMYQAFWLVRACFCVLCAAGTCMLRVTCGWGIYVVLCSVWVACPCCCMLGVDGVCILLLMNLFRSTDTYQQWSNCLPGARVRSWGRGRAMVGPSLCKGFRKLSNTLLIPLPLSQPTHLRSHEVRGKCQRASHLNSSKSHQEKRQWAQPG